MKIIHISDLHIGKTIRQISLYEDQKYILLTEIMRVIDSKKPDVVLLSGDIFDTSIPSGESLVLYQDFLKELLNRNIKVLSISGNHDSPVRIDYLKELLSHSGYYVSGCYKGHVDHQTLRDEYGDVCFYLLPYLSPESIRPYFKDVKMNTDRPYELAVSTALNAEDIDCSKRNVILSHQFVIGGKRDPSDTVVSFGKANISDQVSLSVYSKFDYVALGHIHKSMIFDNGRIVYPGAILPYHEDESNDRYVSYVELGEKGNIKQELIKINPKHKILKIRDEYASVLSKPDNKEDFVAITLTGEVNDPQASVKLSNKFDKLISIRRESMEFASSEQQSKFSPAKEPIDTISEFYKTRTGHDIDEGEEKIVKDILKEIMEGDTL